MNGNLHSTLHIESKPNYKWYDDLMKLQGANWNFLVHYEVSNKLSHNLAIHRISETVSTKLNEKTFEH